MRHEDLFSRARQIRTQGGSLGEAHTRVAALEAATPAGSSGTDFGPSSWEIPLFAVEQPVGSFVSANVGWVFDSTASRGGYVTRSAPAQNDYFGFVVPLHPKGAIFALYYTSYLGSDFGKLDIDIASLGYQLPSRSVGDPAGKIQSPDSGYGTAPVFKSLVAGADWYNATPLGESGNSGILTFIPGGDEGDPLTDYDVATDPFTGYAISDGGPGWYAIRFKVASKNAASSGYRMKVASVAMLRVSDDSGV